MIPSSASKPFEQVAPYYDLLMHEIPYLWWLHYIEVLLEHHERTEVQRVLDLCCGTGNLTELLVLSGFEAVGVDLSEPMIQRARQKAQEHDLPITYYVQDASELDLPETFDGVVSLFDSLNNIIQPERFAECLRRVYRHLRPQGIFIFDLNTEYAFKEKMFDQSNRRSRAPLRYHWRSEYDPSTRLCTVRMEFWVREEGQERYFQEIHCQRAYSNREVETMLVAAGFSEVYVYDAYTLDPPTNRSDRVFFVALV
ncbi:MAG: methyltransferase domain-containing protein [Fimbriimonadales bacterium]